MTWLSRYLEHRQGQRQWHELIKELRGMPPKEQGEYIMSLPPEKWRNINISDLTPRRGTIEGIISVDMLAKAAAIGGGLVATGYLSYLAFAYNTPLLLGSAASSGATTMMLMYYVYRL